MDMTLISLRQYGTPRNVAHLQQQLYAIWRPANDESLKFNSGMLKPYTIRRKKQKERQIEYGCPGELAIRESKRVPGPGINMSNG